MEAKHIDQPNRLAVSEDEVDAMVAELEGRGAATATWTEPFAASDKGTKNP